MHRSNIVCRVQQYVGVVENAVFDESSVPARRIIVSTAQNVLAALSIKNGENLVIFIEFVNRTKEKYIHNLSYDIDVYVNICEWKYVRKHDGKSFNVNVVHCELVRL